MAFHGHIYKIGNKQKQVQTGEKIVKKRKIGSIPLKTKGLCIMTKRRKKRSQFVQNYHAFVSKNRCKEIKQNTLNKQSVKEEIKREIR